VKITSDRTFEKLFRKTYAEIDLDAYVHNWKLIRGALPDGVFFCPMVKANAYGHGDVAIARVLESLGEQNVGVCLIEEGARLREYGVRINILVYRGFDRAGAEEIIRLGLTPVVGTWEQLDYLLEFAKTPVSVYLKFNTGMNRLGFSCQEAEKLFDRVKNEPMLKLEGVLTHLFHGEDANLADGDSFLQLKKFDHVVDVFEALKPVSHCLNSSGILHRVGALKHQQEKNTLLTKRPWGARPGLVLYGVSPLADEIKLDLRPVMTLKSRVSIYHRLQVGESVSYGATWTASRESTIAVVPIGYADGYHRSLSNRADALFNGERVPVVGTVCMDFLMLDITDYCAKHGLSGIREFDSRSLHPSLKEAEVVLFGCAANGACIGADELAQQGDTIAWEIMTSVSERVPRLYTGALATVARDMES
jgi:alanine racemase